MEKFKIIADSSADTLELVGANYTQVPLKIITAEQEYVDDAALDPVAMARAMQQYKGRSSTSCPNTEEWLTAFGDAEYVFCVAITASLSGSYNAACVAKTMYEAEHPGRRVHVINSLSTGPEMRLIIEKLRDLIEEGLSFDEIVDRVGKYSAKTGLLFMLESMKNLANNGRCSPVVAKAAGLLGIRVIGRASDRGDLEILSKVRGREKALDTIISHLRSLGFAGGKIRISHCDNESAALSLRERILKEFSRAKIEVYPCRGLCSFYAELGGMLVGFETAQK